MSLADAPSLAFALRTARERSGRSHQDLAEITRVRRDYLIALEQGAYDRLPSRPFAVGYVRAYAQALGLDEETAADRFKAECPDRSSPLAAPVGSELDDVKPRSGPWIAVIAVVVLAVVGWNVAQHMLNAPKSKPSALAQAGGAKAGNDFWKMGGGVIRLAAPGPAPEGQGLPAPYATPGLPETGQTTQSLLQPVSMTGPVIPTGAAFNPKGPIYGADARASAVTLQARKSASVVLRSADGVNVVFAKQLAVGESYRAPLGQGDLRLDVSDPGAFDVYMNGEYHGALPAQVTPLSQLNAQAAQLAAQAHRNDTVDPDDAGPTPASDAPTPGI